MQPLTATSTLSEQQFGALVEALTSDPTRRAELTDATLLFVLEELDTGRDAYLVAAAARALRSYPKPVAAFAPFVMRAIANIRYHDEYVAFEHYGQYATSATETTPLHELLATLVWLGPYARDVLPE